MKTIITIPHDGYMLTIAEVIEAFERLTNAKIIRIIEADGRLSFEIAEPKPEIGPDNEDSAGIDEDMLL